MKPTDYAKIAGALGISTIEAAELEAEWRLWHDFQRDKAVPVTLRPHALQR